MSGKKTTEQLFDFIQSSPSPYHAVETALGIINRACENLGGVEVLSEGDPSWHLEPDRVYAVKRNGSSIAFFRMPSDSDSSTPKFSVAAAHTDSPTFALKDRPEIPSEGYVRLDVAEYGGAIKQSWFDRTLSIAGRVFLDTPNGIREELVDLRDDLVVSIPSLAPHMGETGKLSVQREMLPISGMEGDESSIADIIAGQFVFCEPLDILGYDLSLYVLDKPRLWGAGGQFVSSPRLDDLACACTSSIGFAESLFQLAPNHIPILFLLDNEEIGSRTRQGADSTFVSDVLERISLSLGMGRVEHMAALSRSTLVSADNAHALHPAYPDKADPVNRPVLNKGIVLKHATNKRYCTDGASGAAFAKLCRDNDIPYQDFHNHSDIAGGSTLGNIVLAHSSMKALDIGVAQLAMHSAVECCGCDDVETMARFFSVYFGRGMDS